MMHPFASIFSRYGSASYIIGSKLLKRLYTKIESRLDATDQISLPNKFRSTTSFGQPVAATHPHLLKSGELLPGIQLGEFKHRRQKLMNLIINEVLKTYGKTMHVVVIIPSATRLYMTEKIPYVFRQNADFLYLSGCLEPDTALVLSGSDIKNFVSTIFVRQPDAHSQLWDGPRTGADDAPGLFGVDDAFALSELSKFLEQTADGHPSYLLFYDSQYSSQLPIHNTITTQIKKYGITVFRTATYFLHQLRVIKSVAEQELMRRAGEISSAAINKAIQASKPGMTEHQLFAIVDYESRMRGAEILAYVPVIACGENATIIHYIDNRQALKGGELVLMDAGCEYHGYSGDITRTWPVNGKFDKFQRILYEIVLDVQMQLISLCQERASLDTIYTRMIRLLAARLHEEKIVKQITTNDELLTIARDLCPHHSSHFLGMDIHDVNSTSKNISLQPGMIITVEPGLYIRKSCTNVAPEFRNLGIRIEDDVLITDTGFEVLSSRCPKTVDDIENMMKK